MKVDFLVVGAGFSGSVVAERLANYGFDVLIIDQRPHIGGNAFDTFDRHGVLMHPYGPHIFHTNAARVVQYLSQFTQWRRYEHHVLAKVGDQFVPFPINIDTINQVYGLSLDEETIQGFYDSVREPRAEIKTSEDVVLNAVGHDLYEKFFRGYTRKQWGLDPSQLLAAVAARIPTRTNRDARYFTDEFQCMPLKGYTQPIQGVDVHEASVRIFASDRPPKVWKPVTLVRLCHQIGLPVLGSAATASASVRNCAVVATAPTSTLEILSASA